MLRRHWMVQKKELDPGSQGSDGGLDLDDETTGDKTKSSSEHQTPIEGESQSPFKNPKFKGLTEEEIAAKLELAELTVKEQGRKLNDLSRQPRSAADPNVQTPIKEKTSEEFWKDPVSATRDIIRTEMREIIKPFENDRQRSEVRAAWEEAKEDYPDIYDYKDLIQAELNANRVDVPNPGTLKLLYLAARGRRDIEREKTGEERTPTPNGAPRRNPPPQHPPSSQPLNKEKDKPTLRDLTELEDRMRRERKMSKEEFIKWMDADDADVLEVKD